MTRRYLVEAGISPGQRMVELGCDPGEVTQVKVPGRLGPRRRHAV
ncbi:MAG: hypothetical protein AAFX50_20645 [Acidobacteriota bacterium]